jgi:hypothetical protein
MATRRKVNTNQQVKTINGQRWLCERVFLTDTTQIGDYDFIHESDGLPWKKIRPWKFIETRNTSLAGQHQDDKNDSKTSVYVDSGYVVVGYVV